MSTFINIEFWTLSSEILQLDTYTLKNLLPLFNTFKIEMDGLSTLIIRVLLVRGPEVPLQLICNLGGDLQSVDRESTVTRPSLIP